VATETDSTNQSSSPEPTKPTLRQFLKSRPDIVNRVVILGVVVSIVVILVVLFTVPVPTSFSTSFSDSCIGGIRPETCPTENFPMGAYVSGTFSTIGGSPAGLQIVGENGPVFFSTVSSGSFSFTASNPPYQFAPAVGGDGSTSVSGEYTSPVIVL